MKQIWRGEEDTSADNSAPDKNLLDNNHLRNPKQEFTFGTWEKFQLFAVCSSHH